MLEGQKTESVTGVVELKEQVRRLESRLANLERPNSIYATSAFIETDEISSGLLSNETESSRQLSYLPAIRACDFAEFKNRFSENDARYAVDVLVTGPPFEQELLEEQRLRDRLLEHGYVDSRLAGRRARALAKEFDRSNNELRNYQNDRTSIQRIRIQAPALLDILARIQGESWSIRPRTYTRPFCSLIQCHDEVRQIVRDLEGKSVAQGIALPSNTSSHNTESESNIHQIFIDDSSNTVDILRAYVDFMDRDIIPQSCRYHQSDHSSGEQIGFWDLCYLFRPGDMIYKPAEREKSGDSRGHQMGQLIWRVCSVNDAINTHGLQLSDERQVPRAQNGSDRINFTVQAYHIDFTGEEFCVVPTMLPITPYEGRKSINDLPFYPLRFYPDHGHLLTNARRVGDQVLSHLSQKHAIYNAWTVLRTPHDEFVTDAREAVLKYPEFINSEVMIDFQEAFLACPSWQPHRTVFKAAGWNEVSLFDNFTIRIWSGRDRSKLIGETKELISYSTGVHQLQHNKFIQEDQFLAAVARNQQTGLLTSKEHLTDKEKCLIHCRVFAYIFRERKFAQLDAMMLQPMTRNLEALDSLKIPLAQKRLIQGTVRGHFMDKDTRDRDGVDGPSQDVISGKGSGLFILLHGVPGVGKTMTAEAIAQANGKPLFKITCGDIGLTPDQVESSLRRIFRLASIWDCILLIDEVDTFFSQRSKGDAAVTKNALVSVFLRILDYYNGILFLTTNRAGTLDEAFKSRIHFKIYYPPLTKDQTMSIWQLNIARLHQIGLHAMGKRPLEIPEAAILTFANDQFDEARRKGTGSWNGRQIRNAFQVARSLAHYDALLSVDDAQPNDVAPAILNVDYFHLMHDITGSFDQYMLEVYSGQNDGDLALELEHRADHWTTDRWSSSETTRVNGDAEDTVLRHNGGKSPFDVESGADHAGHPRTSSSFRGSRLPGSTTSQQLLGNFMPPSATQYNMGGLEGQSSPLQRQRSSPSHECDRSQHQGLFSSHTPTSMGSARGREIELVGAGSASHGTGFGSSDAGFRGSGIGFKSNRDTPHFGESASEQNYQVDRNGYGKRGRLM